MAKRRALPDLTTRFKVDYSELTKGEKAAAKMHGEFQKGATKSTTHTLRFTESLTTMLGHIAKVPPVVDTAARSLESMSSQNVGKMQLLGGVAAASLGLIAEGAHISIDAYKELGEKVENYKRVTGSSAEESGRMVQTFIALGVSEESASNGMFKLSKAIETTPGKLAALGVAVARDAEGNVDLNRTLLNVADTYNRTLDPAQKNLILFTAFGRAGREMIPVLEQGSDSLKRLEEQAALTFTDADLQRLKQTQIQQNQVKQGWDAMWASIGQKLLPAQQSLYESINRGTYVQKRLNEAVDAGTLSYDEAFGMASNTSEISAKLTSQYIAEYDASLKVSKQLAEQTQNVKSLTEANDALVKTTDDLISADDKLYKINENIAAQSDKVKSAQLDLHDAEKLLSDDRKRYGANSEQAARDTIALHTAQRTLTDTIRQGGQDRRQQVIDQEAQTNATRDTNKENQAEISYYTAMLKHVGKGSPLYKKMEEWIALLKSTPTNVTTDIVGDFHTFGPAAGPTKHAALGAHLQAGEVAWTGERGIELFKADRPGTVIPNDKLGQALAGGGDTIYNITVPVQGTVVTPRELVVAIREGIRRIDREQS